MFYIQNSCKHKARPTPRALDAGKSAQLSIDIKKMNFTKVRQSQEIWCKRPSGLESH